MFSYYGSKSKVVDYYPKPKCGKIIEPFAGSARYSLKYFENDIFLIDEYEIIVRIWKYLQTCSPNDILSLPKLKQGEAINRDDFDCIEQAWLMGFLITNGVATPMLTMSKWGEVVFEKQRNDIAQQLWKIKHWKIKQGKYSDLVNEKATWFIDPPYQVGGHRYKHNNKKLNYKDLANWCKSRNGQTIVCENTNANWMNFKPMREQNGIVYRTTEAIWSNHKTNYDAVQQSLQL